MLIISPGWFSTFVPMSRRKTIPAAKPARMALASSFGHTACLMVLVYFVTWQAVDLCQWPLFRKTGWFPEAGEDKSLPL